MKVKNIQKRIAALSLCCLTGVAVAVAANYADTKITQSKINEMTREERLLLFQDDEFLSKIKGVKIKNVWFPSEEMKIYTNENGDTYGEALFVKYMDLDADLISAIGKNHITGYIWRSSLHTPLPPDIDEIPIYASDGVTVVDWMRMK